MEATITIVTEFENYLKRQDMSMKQFSETSGINCGTLSKLIHGHRPLSIRQLDRITQCMGLVEGCLYDLFIDSYIAESPTNWRRISPLLYRSAELDKLDCIQRIVQIVMDNLMYLPMLFETAEEFLLQGRREAAALLYECVAQGEKYQHSERLALCQYRLFMITLGDNQDINLRAANQFEPFVERLDALDQLDALKELANTYRSLQRWDRVEQVASVMGYKAKLQYDLKNQFKLKTTDITKTPSRPLFFYIAYSNLLRANVCDELGDYEQALTYKYAYADLSWVNEQGEEVEYWKNKFIEWSEANIYITRLLSGDISVIEQYVTFIEQRKEEKATGLLYILKAANKYHLNVDEILNKLKEGLETSSYAQMNASYSRKLVLDRQANLMFELAQYYLNKEEFSNGFSFLLNAMKNYKLINNEKYLIENVALLKKTRCYANEDIQDQNQNLLF